MTQRHRPMRFESPLSPVSGRFPLGLTNFAAPRSDEPASGPGVRPFGLRFATTVSWSGEEVPGWQYCHRRQITLVADGSGEAYYRRFASGQGSMATTGPSPGRHREYGQRGVDSGLPG
jgi:hypothetical protein